MCFTLATLLFQADRAVISAGQSSCVYDCGTSDGGRIRQPEQIDAADGGGVARRGALELHPVLEESFILVFPSCYQGSTDIVSDSIPLPLIRFSRLTGTGQQIERQIVRMKLKLPTTMEVESSHQQLGLVAAGLGWTITPPICLAAVPELLPKLKPLPMTRGRFARQVQVVARAGELGNIPRLTASVCQRVLRETTFSRVTSENPWIEEHLRWPSTLVGNDEA